MKTKVVCLLTIILTTSSVFSPNPELKIQVFDLRNTDGQLMLSVFNSKDGFPGNADAIVLKKTLQLKDNKPIFLINELKPGEYAFSIIHDENGDNELKTNFIGMPKEGIATSNNAKGTMGPPKYKDAKFILEQAGKKMLVNMVYM